MVTRLAAAGLVAAVTGGCLPAEPSVGDHLECAEGRCRCLAGFGNCDGLPANGCETDFASDPRHCGVCQHDCLGGDCEAGACERYEPAEGLFEVTAAAALGRTVFFGESYLGLIGRVGDDGTGLTLLAADQLLELGSSTTRTIRVADDRVFWAAYDYGGFGELRQVSVSGGVPVTYAHGYYLGAAAAGAGRTAWVEFAPGTGWRVRLADLDGVLLGTYSEPGANSIGDVVLDAQGVVYWYTSEPAYDYIRAADGGAKATTHYSTVSYLRGLAVGGGLMLWAEQGGSQSPGLIRWMAPGAATPQSVETLSALPRCPAPLGDVVYWVDGATGVVAPVLRAPLAGGAAELVAAIRTEKCPELGERTLAWVENGYLYELAR